MSGMIPPEDRLRSHFYSLMARLLAKPPDRRLLDLLQQIPSDASPVGEMAAAWAELRKAALPAEPEAETAEYDRLFIGVNSRAILPYASWYLTGRLAGKPLAILRQDLSRLGFERTPRNNEPEDHVAALCETMAMLCAGYSVSEQTNFFSRHMAPWIERFMSDLEESAETAFYRAVGNIGRLFFHFETETSSVSEQRRSNEEDHTARF